MSDLERDAPEPTTLNLPSASPASTGGSGNVMEFRLGATALAALLYGDRVRGLSGAVARVSFQQGFVGRDLDEVILHVVSVAGKEYSVDFQSKRSLRPTAATLDFVDVVTAAVKTMRRDPEGTRSQRHALRLAAARPRGPLEQLATLTELAKGHADADGFWVLLVGDGIGQVEKRRLDELRQAVKTAIVSLDLIEPSESEVRQVTWALARDLVVWIAELEGREADVLHAINRLGEVFGGEIAEAIFAQLMDLSAQWDLLAATADLGMLRVGLDSRGVRLGVDYAHRVAFERLLASTSQVLSAADRRIGRTLNPERREFQNSIRLSALTHQCTIVSGKPGAGKSVIARRAMKEIQDAGDTVIALELTAGMSIVDFNALYAERLADALCSAPTGSGRVLLIDGGEQVLADGRMVLRRLLSDLPLLGDAPQWNLVIVSRDEAVPSINEELHTRFTQVMEVRVGDLTDPEVAEVILRRLRQRCVMSS